MRKISITITETEQLNIVTNTLEDWHPEDGISIDFFFVRKNMPEREYIMLVRKSSVYLEWIKLEGSEFIFDLATISKHYPQVFENCAWMNGLFLINPTIDRETVDNNIIISFCMTKGEIVMSQPKKIFLSHKGSNKPLVRSYFELLKELGYEPWLDEDAMVAGMNPDRAILQGFKDSCACVFFITPEFVDESFLSDEIENALVEKREKVDRFSIITLQLADQAGLEGKIPELLRRRFIYKKPLNALDAFKEIIRALPIKVGFPLWK